MKASSAIALSFLLIIACEPKKNTAFLNSTTGILIEDVTYEGRWNVDGGVVRIELTLRATPGLQGGDYQLREVFDSKGFSAGAESSGSYTTFGPLASGQFQIQLHNVKLFDKMMHFRYRDLGGFDSNYHIFLLQRGQRELLPCDQSFSPITRDRRYTLHQRSRLFTIEGYITVNADSTIFFERNTREHWQLANLGEIEEAVRLYREKATQKFEGVYLRALAYSVADTIPTASRELLVIKRITSKGPDTN